MIGYQFDRAICYSAKDASLFSNLAGDASYVLANRGTGFAVTISGLTATVGSGQALVKGRLSEILTTESVVVPANSNGFLVVHVDLTQVNTSTGTPGTSNYVVVNNQLKLKFVTSLIQDDILNGATSYMLNLGGITSTASTLTYTKNLEAFVDPSANIMAAITRSKNIAQGSIIKNAGGNSWVNLFTLAQVQAMFGDPATVMTFNYTMILTNGDNTAFGGIMCNAWSGTTLVALLSQNVSSTIRFNYVIFKSTTLLTS